MLSGLSGGGVYTGIHIASVSVEDTPVLEQWSSSGVWDVCHHHHHHHHGTVTSERNREQTEYEQRHVRWSAAVVNTNQLKSHVGGFILIRSDIRA